MVPEILSVTDRIFCHFGPFFDLLPPKNSQNQNFEKQKQKSGDIIILHMCTKNHDHMLYGSLDMMCNRFNCYFSFLAIFYPFTEQPKKSKFRKNEENARRCHHFTQVYLKL